jgi:hypothetical protein
VATHRSLNKPVPARRVRLRAATRTRIIATMTGRSVAGTAGLVLLLAGLLLGFLPRSAQGVTCGSAFVASGKPYVSDLLGETRGARADCVDTRSGARTPAIVLLSVGGALTLGAATRPGKPTPEPISGDQTEPRSP